MKKVNKDYNIPESEPSFVNEPMVLGFFASSVIGTGIDRIASIKLGIPASKIEEVREAFGLTQLTMADMLHLNPKTLRSKISQKGTIDPLHGSLVLAMSELHQKGKSVFGSQVSFLQWMNFPSPALGNKQPMYFLDTFQGIRLIFSELESIEEGAFA